MPLIVPDHFNTYTVMGIDPGLSNTGVATFELTYGTDEIVKIEAFTLVNDKLLDLSGVDDETHLERTVKLFKLKQAFLYVLANTNPAIIASESPFFNKKFPGAYAPLVEVMNVLLMSIVEWNNNVKYYTFAPSTTKQAIGARPVKNNTEEQKKEIQRAILAYPNLLNVLVTPVEQLSQHAFDAIAAGITLIQSRRA